MICGSRLEKIKNEPQRHSQTDNTIWKMARVTLNIYDLHDVNDKVYCIGLGAFHSGVEVYGKEYAFGFHDRPTSGIWSAKPKEALFGKTLRISIDMGETKKTQGEMIDILDELAGEWLGTSYHMLEMNCNHFSDTFCKRLLNGKGIPNYVNRLANISKLFSCFIPAHMVGVPKAPPPQAPIDHPPRSSTHTVLSSPPMQPTLVMSNSSSLDRKVERITSEDPRDSLLVYERERLRSSLSGGTAKRAASSTNIDQKMTYNTVPARV
ncbi:hypothetical protein PROFUN_08618 [Planoprotostelium fungivorum]|uniref:PPPDE domain-containing protein n=1 Tax=Planoprotostelium fungivorum TaxID=1890364 RepID=A0A2P6NJA0_9EUKA|nr:hypothetical protein PROFUN_08618 [Planoprotostelium fungivorum]